MQRFWSKVKKGPGCWEWQAGPAKGYGIFWYKGRNVGAHRFAWELTKGPIPAGLRVCHRCDNVRCVRAEDHLFLGTDKDNHKDMIDKKRRANFKGSKNPTSKLTEKQIKKIRSISGMSQSEIAYKYDVNQSTISRILSKRNWKGT